MVKRTLKHNFLITGGAGYLGSYLTDQLITNDLIADRLVVYSRDELKHFRQRNKIRDSRVSWTIGDVRDYDRLEESFKGIDVVIHTAAMKHLDACEQNQEECIKTNVIGTENVIKACKHAGVKYLIFISTDKAVEPISAYGNSKQTGEKLVLKANSADLTTTVIRLGNLLGSTGSIKERISEIEHGGSFTLYHPDLTRFADSSENAFDLVKEALMRNFGGCILVPKLKGFKVRELVESLRPDLRIQVQSGRNYEKIHEKLASENELERMLAAQNYYIVPTSEMSSDQAIDMYRAFNASTTRYGSHQVSQVSFGELVRSSSF